MVKSNPGPLWLALASMVIALSLPAQTFSPWAKVENLGPIVNSTASDSCLFISPSGRSLYFASTRPGGLGLLDLYVTQRADRTQPWGEPKSLGPTMNSTGSDHLPFITPDGHTMIFASDRTGTLGLNDLYWSFRRNAADDFGWEAPVPIPGVNTAAEEYAPWGFTDPATGRLVLYFASDRSGGVGGFDIYSSTLDENATFSAPAVVAEINTTASDVMPTIRADGLELYLTSTRTGALGSSDIWRSTRATTAEPWSAPMHVEGPVNSTAGEQRGHTFGDATELYFFSGRPGGVGGTDLYRATRTRTTLIPVAGRTGGADGSAFVTSAQLNNPAEPPISGRIVFHPAGVPASSNDPSYTYQLGPYASQTLADVMESIGATGVGSLEIIPDEGSSPASTFRIHRGESAVVVPPVGPETIMVAGTHSALKMPADTDRFRMNISVRTFDTGAAIWVCMHDPDGTYIRGYNRYFAANTLVQMSVADLYSGEVEGDKMLMFTVNAGSAVIVASSIANDGPGMTLQMVRSIND